ncbi:flagellar hook protein FlgE [Geodermatophilus sp. URMC 64]
MLRSMFSAISGLRAHQTKMDVVGNNIANVNTVGFKSSSTVFEDTLSQVLRNGSAPTADTAGTNPAQVGLGVKVAGITTNFSQGSTQNTGRSTDFMISGDGFFMTQSGNETLYTRAGSFDFDGVGNLVTPDGAILQGWMAVGGVINTNGPVDDLKIPYGQIVAPVATTGGAAAGNLSAEAVSTDAPVQTQVTMYDALGNEHQISYVFTKDALPATTWTMKVMEGATQYGANQTLGFSATGVMTTPAAKEITGLTVPWGTIDIDLTKVTQYGGKSTVTATTTVDSGSALGTLESFSLGNDGTITGIYSNGRREPIGQLALATFTNPSGLTKAGNSSYRVGDNSGNPLVGVAGTGGRGTLTAGALEMSNVDLSEEFTGLIVAQRGFQANSKVITASDEILQDLVNLKR